MASGLVLAGVWTVVAWRAPGLADQRQRAPWIALAGLALALTGSQPAVAAAVDRAAGIADLAVLARHLAGVVGCTALLDWISALANPAREPGLRRRHVLGAVTMTALIVLFPVMSRPETGDFAATVSGGPGAAYLLVFNLYLGTAMATATVLFWQLSRGPVSKVPRAFGWGLRLLAAGTFTGTGYAAYEIGYLILRATPAASPVISPAGAVTACAAGAAILNLAVALILAGLTVPAFGTAWNGLRDLALLRSLDDMRTILLTAAPHIKAGPLPFRTDLRFPRPHLRLTRRVTEIRDAAGALRSAVAPGPVAVARDRLKARGLTGTALDAATEACWLRLALRAAWTGAPPVTIPHQLPGHADFQEDARWLAAVSRAARTEAVTAVTRELSGETTSSASVRWPSVTAANRRPLRVLADRVTGSLSRLILRQPDVSSPCSPPCSSPCQDHAPELA